ncbi:hypothetical protein ARMGADRAFT_1016383 [Armillaria gallica]|uniref:Uncharacterized protein n=1 Tax=Armillaria gallica TaxID=47427 RepID=A0A2H3D215_ARMGA|nr:hypothetical protein ARMGADRAFT_1016383 [Armillaria gallica]
MPYLNAPVRLGGYNNRTQPPLNTSHYSSMNDPGLLRPLCPPEQAQRFRNQGPPNRPRDTILASTHRSSSSLPSRASTPGAPQDSIQQVPQVLDKGKGKEMVKTHKRSDSTFTFGKNRPTPGTTYRKSWSSHESKNSGILLSPTAARKTVATTECRSCYSVSPTSTKWQFRLQGFVIPHLSSVAREALLAF